jgi:DNA-directed RNA polymerase subunit RPC12/RpoP
MNFLSSDWLVAVLEIGGICIVIAVLMVFLYEVRLQSIRGRSEKYRFASARESKNLRAASVIMAIGVAFISFFLISRAIGQIQSYLYYFIGFFSVLISFVVGYGAWVTLKFYYPFVLEKRLQRIRFKPMKSPKSGNPMRILNENEEDAHLTEEMMAEEDSFTVDYDVWMDDATGYTVIEKYDTHYHALVCENCNFRTLKLQKEEIVREPTRTEEGMLQNYYKCSYCGYSAVKEERIPSWSEESQYANIEEAPDDV